MFWFVPLTLAASLFSRVGFYEEGFGFTFESIPLLGIPILMIGLTLSLTSIARHRPLPDVVVVGASATAFIAAIWWLAVWGEGV